MRRALTASLCIAAISLLPVAPSHALTGDPTDFSEWKNRPREPFPDADKSFDRARRLLLDEAVDDRMRNDDLLRAAVAGMAAGSGRKWDRLMSPAEKAEMSAELSGEFAGIGIEIKFDAPSGVTTVLYPLPASPAEKAGVSAGDRILKIDGRSFKGMDIRDVVSTMRGRVGTPVRLTILRDDKVLDATVVRAPITMATVADRMLDGGVALIAVRAFNDRTPGQLREALSRLQGAGARYLVLDLRGDQGGLLERMIESAALLLPKGRTVATQIGRGGRETPLVTSTEPVLRGLPVAVLVDGETASGAEILAAALKQHAGARLVGKRTLGKWNVQRIEELPNHWALKFTVGVFRSAGGELLDGKGLEPDVEVEQGEHSWESQHGERDPQKRVAGDAQLRTAIALLRAAR